MGAYTAILLVCPEVVLLPAAASSGSIMRPEMQPQQGIQSTSKGIQAQVQSERPKKCAEAVLDREQQGGEGNRQRGSSYAQAVRPGAHQIAEISLPYVGQPCQP